MVDMDDPHEVKTAWRNYWTAATTIGDEVVRVVKQFEVPSGPKSELDRELDRQTKAIQEQFFTRVGLKRRRVTMADGHVVLTVDALTQADVAGAAQVRRTEML